MSNSVVRKQAWKPYGEATKAVCPWDDPGAVEWHLAYPGMPYSCSTLEFSLFAFRDLSAVKYRAETFAHALARAFEAGRKSGRAEVREFILGTKPLEET